MPLTIEDMQAYLRDYTPPKIGSATASPTDEAVRDNHGTRPLLLWAAEIRWVVPDNAAKDIPDLLAKALDRASADVKKEAERAGCLPHLLVTSPIKFSAPRVDDAGLNAEMYMYFRVEDVNGRKK